MKAKIIPFLAALAALFTFAGCSTPIVNLTVPQVPQNPSGIYTLSCNARLSDGAMITGSLKGYVVIEGTERPMKLSPYGDQIFEYEYAMPSDRSQATYYFVLKYNALVNSLTVPREVKSQLYTFNVVNVYVLTLEATRGPVGATITLVGRGFTKADSIVIGGLAAQTIYSSTNAMSFVVPPLPARKDYAVEVHSGSRVQPVGLFRVDPSDFSVTPSALEMASGDTLQLVIGIERNAPEGGLPIEVLTDVPGSIVMPVIGIPAGSRSINVKVQGAQPGKGSLHLSAPGFNELLVPVIVIPKADNAPAAPAAPTPPPPAAPIIMGS